MKKNVIIMLAALVAAGAAFGQEAPGQGVPRLGILPFTGGQGRDGDTIATLFANSRELGKEFAIVPRTSSVEAIMREQEFQRTSGLTDTDTIARLGKLANADYVVSGHVARLGNANLLLISIVNVETMEQIAGDHRTYGKIEEVSALLPEMAARIIDSARRRTVSQGADRPNLAIPALDIQDERVMRDDAELLARILATEIANTHKYTVLPRTSTINTVLQEQGVQQSGLTERATLAAIGKALNAQYVLSGTIANLGSQNLFTAQILDIETATLRPGAGSSRQYQNLEDGITLMRELAREISGVTDDEARAEEDRAAAEAEAAREREAQAAAAAANRQRAEASRRAGMDISVGLLFLGGATGPLVDEYDDYGTGETSIRKAPTGIHISLNYAFSPMPYVLIDFGFGLGGIFGVETTEYPEYYSNRTKTDDFTDAFANAYAHGGGYLSLGSIDVYGGLGLGYASVVGKDWGNPSFDLVAGIYFGRLKAGYLLRIPFKGHYQKSGETWHTISVGYSFGKKP